MQAMHPMRTADDSVGRRHRRLEFIARAMDRIRCGSFRIFARQASSFGKICEASVPA